MFKDKVYLQHEILGLISVLQDSWRSYAYWDEIELWEVEMAVMAACVVGRVRDCVFCIFDERHVAVVGIELWMSQWVSRLVFGESRRYLYAGLRSDRHSQFWGDIKLCLCEACWMHLIYIQLGFLVRNP